MSKYYWIRTIIDLRHEFHIRKAVFKGSGKSISGREEALLASQILNKTKDFLESLKFYNT